MIIALILPEDVGSESMNRNAMQETTGGHPTIGEIIEYYQRDTAEPPKSRRIGSDDSGIHIAANTECDGR